jgi:hypothetical protein
MHNNSPQNERVEHLHFKRKVYRPTETASALVSSILAVLSGWYNSTTAE